MKIYHNVELAEQPLPTHVAIIMDGNSRWATGNNYSRLIGHRQGLEALVEIVQACNELDIQVLSVYAFSTENWKRSLEEVQGLMRLFEYFYKREFKRIMKNNIKVLHSGELHEFSPDIAEIIQTMIDESKNNTGNILNIALNYSSKAEILNAVRQIGVNKKNGEIDPDNLDINDIEERLYNPELPHPDLIIRTSGEKRLSNFMLWQVAYSEFYFSDIFWPEFTKKDFAEAIRSYQRRDRRFGGRLIS